MNPSSLPLLTSSEENIIQIMENLHKIDFKKTSNPSTSNSSEN